MKFKFLFLFVFCFQLTAGPLDSLKANIVALCSQDKVLVMLEKIERGEVVDIKSFPDSLRPLVMKFIDRVSESIADIWFERQALDELDVNY